MKIKKYI